MHSTELLYLLSLVDTATSSSLLDIVSIVHLDLDTFTAVVK